ncbi:IS110 family transposase [Nonomuraea sp. KC401]|uniref:IS110 family transposase n=1 Tax=unclassified Nonomuraea TaxID=2593643 RepID=UPI0010FE6885|nr:IS110 family transposase [Nonomuraea sp. KC401]NBE98009.1 IS110 family transposase [Nonomuraea sp. K271]TLF60039.1 IS110 family transposase [Nonomuraea sp. KC401]
MQETEEPLEFVQRVAALDIGKSTLMACIRVPHEDKPGRRLQEVGEYATTTRSLLALADRLRCQGVTLVAMEATSDYWKPAFYLLEAEGFECWLLNAKHVKNVPGRPKTDKLDAVWLAKVVERGMCRPSFVPPKPIRQLRDLTRYRRTLVRERSSAKQRLEKILEDAQIKLTSVISNLLTVSGRQMLQAMIDGERSPKVLAEMARGKMRAKLDALQEALTGHFDEHHAFLCTMMLARIDDLTARIGELSQKIEQVMEPFTVQVDQLIEVTGVGRSSAQEIIAEIGVDMTRFSSSDHLVAWARYSPQTRQSAGKTKSSTTGKGNWLSGALGEIGIATSRTDTFLGARYRRIAKRRGKRRALVAVGNSVLTIAWHLLSDPDARFNDLGPGFYESRINKERQTRNLMRQLEQLTGRPVVLGDAAA